MQPKQYGYDSMMEKNLHAVALGRLGGLVRSEAKATAARANGKRRGRPRGTRGKHGGGRPKKFVNWRP